MEKLSLDDTWKYCIEMWNDIIKDSSANSVVTVKRSWLIKHDFFDVAGDCFFCDYARQERISYSKRLCDWCPGVLIDCNFGCCKPSYNYASKPVKFNRKINSLYEIYLKNKKYGKL